MRNHECWLNAYLTHSAASEAPDIMHFWTGVSVVAGALRRRVWIDQKFFQWTPNFYIVLVAPPGVVNKSTTADIGMRLLKRVKGVHFGANSMTWQALTEDLARATEIMKTPGQAKGTPMSCLTIVASEFGSLLDPRDTAMIDVLVDLWDGKLDTWTRATKTQGRDVIQNPWINLIACTTPAWIAGNFPEYMIGGGFTSRTIFIYREKKRHLVAYPADHVDPDFKGSEKRLVEDLIRIATMQGEMILTPEAKEWGIAWYAEHTTNCPTHLAGHRFGGYRARKQGQIHKLAMVISAARDGELFITLSDLQRAEAMVTALEPDLPKVFSWIGASPDAEAVEGLISRITTRGKITKAQLYRSVMREMGFNDFEQAMKGAIAAGSVKAEVKGRDVIYRPIKREGE